MDNNTNEQTKNNRLIPVLMGILLVAIAGGIIFVALGKISANKKATAAKEAARPGDIEITILTPDDCADCFNVGIIADEIKKQNTINVKSEKTLPATDNEAQTLIAKYQISTIPVLIVSGEYNKDENFYKSLTGIGQETNGVMVVEKVSGPYIELADNKKRGVVEVSLIGDKSCADCYNVQDHLASLARLGVPTQGTKILDRNDANGKQLINSYNITLVPTLVITGDTGAYAILQSVWPQVGTTETDGTLIFRAGVKQMGVYKDLTTGQIVEPPTTAQ